MATRNVCYYTAFDIVPTIELSFTRLVDGEHAIMPFKTITVHKLSPIREVINQLGSFNTVAFRETPHSFFTANVPILQAVLLGYSIVLDACEFILTSRVFSVWIHNEQRYIAVKKQYRIDEFRTVGEWKQAMAIDLDLLVYPSILWTETPFNPITLNEFRDDGARDDNSCTITDGSSSRNTNTDAGIIPVAVQPFDLKFKPSLLPDVDCFLSRYTNENSSRIQQDQYITSAGENINSNYVNPTISELLVMSEFLEQLEKQWTNHDIYVVKRPRFEPIERFPVFTANQLSSEILSQIFEQLDAVSLLRVAKVCLTWYYEASSERLWKLIYEKNFPGFFKPLSTYRESYWRWYPEYLTFQQKNPSKEFHLGCITLSGFIHAFPDEISFSLKDLDIFSNIKNLLNLPIRNLYLYDLLDIYNISSELEFRFYNEVTGIFSRLAPYINSPDEYWITRFKPKITRYRFLDLVQVTGYTSSQCIYPGLIHPVVHYILTNKAHYRFLPTEQEKSPKPRLITGNDSDEFTKSLKENVPLFRDFRDIIGPFVYIWNNSFGNNSIIKLEHQIRAKYNPNMTVRTLLLRLGKQFRARKTDIITACKDAREFYYNYNRYISFYIYTDIARHDWDRNFTLERDEENSNIINNKTLIKQLLINSCYLQDSIKESDLNDDIYNFFYDNEIITINSLLKPYKIIELKIAIQSLIAFTAIQKMNLLTLINITEQILFLSLSKYKWDQWYDNQRLRECYFIVDEIDNNIISDITKLNTESDIDKDKDYSREAIKTIDKSKLDEEDINIYNNEFLIIYHINTPIQYLIKQAYKKLEKLKIKQNKQDSILKNYTIFSIVYNSFWTLRKEIELNIRIVKNTSSANIYYNSTSKNHIVFLLQLPLYLPRPMQIISISSKTCLGYLKEYFNRLINVLDIEVFFYSGITSKIVDNPDSSLLDVWNFDNTIPSSSKINEDALILRNLDSMIDWVIPAIKQPCLELLQKRQISCNEIDIPVPVIIIDSANSLPTNPIIENCIAYDINDNVWPPTQALLELLILQVQHHLNNTSNNTIIHLCSKEYFIQLITQCQEIIEAESNIIHICSSLEPNSSRIVSSSLHHILQTSESTSFESSAFCPHVIIIGDLHGSIGDFLYILQVNGMPSPNRRYVLLGDITDSEFMPYSLPLMTLILIIKIIYPHDFYVLLGNRDVLIYMDRLKFTNQLQEYYPDNWGELYARITVLFTCLPFAAIVENRIFASNGGIPECKYKIADINGIDRKKQLDSDKIVEIKELVESKLKTTFDSDFWENIFGNNNRKYFDYYNSTEEKRLQYNTLYRILHSHPYEMYTSRGCKSKGEWYADQTECFLKANPQLQMIITGCGGDMNMDHFFVDGFFHSHHGRVISLTSTSHRESNGTLYHGSFIQVHHEKFNKNIYNNYGNIDDTVYENEKASVIISIKQFPPSKVSKA